MAIPLLLGVLSAGETASSADRAATRSAWTATASLSAKLTLDDNVFLQDRGDLARRGSAVTSLLPSFALAYKPGAAFNAAFSYAPEVAYFHAESTEDHVVHRGSLNFTGRFRDTAWDWNNGVVLINGSNLGPRFTGGGEVPAIGGIALRDRRDAMILRHSLKFTQTRGNVFLRPVLTAYVHDFQTELHAASEPGYAGYLNHIDRHELSSGLDAGLQVWNKTWLVLGYRYGHQEQGKNQYQATSRYSNDYHRFLLGVEGAPASWLKLSVLAGPEIRRFARPAAGFAAGENPWFVDATVTFVPTERSTLIFSARRLQQPAFASHSIYEDIVYEISWKHRFGDRLVTTTGFKAYGGDWQAPVNREDWIMTPSATLSYTHDRNLGVDLSYSFDRAESRLPATAGREFKRQLVSLGVKYSL